MYSLTEAVCRTGGKREKSYGLPLSWIDQFSLGPIEGGRTGGVGTQVGSGVGVQKVPGCP